jgi:hypothetical protein
MGSPKVSERIPGAQEIPVAARGAMPQVFGNAERRAASESADGFGSGNGWAGRDSISLFPSHRSTAARAICGTPREAGLRLNPQNKLSHRYLFCGSVTRGVLP